MGDKEEGEVSEEGELPEEGEASALMRCMQQEVRS
jgi:hypothetical protein